MKINSIFVVAIFLAFSAIGNSAYGQKGKTTPPKSAYEVKFVMPGTPDTVLYVAYYYADKTYMFDTLYVSKKEPYTFIMQGDSLTLLRGMYVVASESRVKYMDFLVDSSYFFTIKTGQIDPERIVLDNITFIDSPENEITSEFSKKMSAYYIPLQALAQELQKKEDLSDEQKEKYKEQIKQYQDSMKIFQENFMQIHANSLFAKVQRMLADIDVPEPPRNPDSTLVDSSWSYQYYINHYWDNCDFSEPALMRVSNFFHQKMTKYFDQVIIPIPDTINKYADILIDKAKDCPDLFRFVVQFITHKYETSQYVGHDAVFVHMVKKYYEKGLCEWVDTAVLEAMTERAEQLDKILIGRKAPFLYMPDTNGVHHHNYEFDKKYTIMWFWDTDCGHCKTATPILKEFYDRAKDSLDFEVFAVCTGTDTVKWKQAIIEKGLTWTNVGKNTANIDYKKVYSVNSTPVVFILDREKNIIAKKIEAKEIEAVIRNYEEGKKIR